MTKAVSIQKNVCLGWKSHKTRLKNTLDRNVCNLHVVSEIIAEIIGFINLHKSYSNVWVIQFVMIYILYTLPLKSLKLVRFLNVSERCFLCIAKHLFDQKYSKNSNNASYYYNLKYVSYANIFLNIIYSCDGKTECSWDISSVCSAMILQKSF